MTFYGWVVLLKVKRKSGEKKKYDEKKERNMERKEYRKGVE